MTDDEHDQDAILCTVTIDIPLWVAAHMEYHGTVPEAWSTQTIIDAYRKEQEAQES